jgi:hypothetical protein
LCVERIDVSDCDLDVEVTVNDSPSVGRLQMSIVVHADHFVGRQVGTLASPDVQHARLGRGLRVFAVNGYLMVTEKVLRGPATAQETADAVDDSLPSIQCYAVDTHGLRMEYAI